MSQIRLILIVLLLSVLPVFVGGQGEQYLEDEVSHRTFEQEEWEEATKGLDYSEKKKKKKKEKKKKERPSFRPDFNISSGAGKMIMKALIIILAVVVVSLILKNIIGIPRNKKIKKDQFPVVVDMDKIEENILEADLEKFIDQALATNNYALAIRLYFLAILKELSLKNGIRWKKDKTNRDYLREMSASPLSDTFQEITNVFELIWYGKGVLTDEVFQRLEGRFQQFLKRISDLNRS